MNLQLLQFWCNLLEQNKSAQQVIEDNIHGTLAALAATIQHLLNEHDNEHQSLAGWTNIEQQHLHSAIKMTIQIIQKYPGKLKDDDSKIPVDKLRQSLTNVLNIQSVPKECVLLAGTALTFLLNLGDDIELVIKTFMDLYSNLDKFSNSNIEVSSLGKTALINGILACGLSQLLFHVIVSKSKDADQQKIFCLWLFHEIISQCKCGLWQYHTFGSLQLWYKKVLKSKNYVTGDFAENMFKQDIGITESTFQLIWTHMDNPIDGVSEIVFSIYRLFLSLYCDNPSPKVPNKTVPFLEKILDNLLQMSWHVKGKHLLIATMLEYIPIRSLFDKEPHLKENLLDCMSTNYLAPSATHLFTAILQACRGQHPVSQDMQEGDERSLGATITEWITEGLCSDDSLLRRNVNNLWLPVCIKLCPDIFRHLMSDLEEQLLQSHLSDQTKACDRDSLLYALLSVLKSSRAHHIQVDLPRDLLQEALYHASDDIRIDAFALISVTPKKSEALSLVEMELLQCSLPYNMNMDSAPFRQQLQTLVRTIVVRARDSALAWLRMRSNDRDDTRLVETVKFLDWLWNLCLDSLHPGSSYQRLKTCLDWMNIILDCLTYQPGRNQKKGNTPESVGLLLEEASCRGLLHLQDSCVVHALLSCLLHGTDEIRESAGMLLQLYMPWPLELSKQTIPNSQHSSLNLLRSALELCDSPRAYDSEGGALLVKLIFDKLVLQKSFCFAIDKNLDGHFTINESTPESAVPHFISQLIDLLKQCVAVATTHVMKAATQFPGHGIVHALQRCLTECQIDFIAQESKWRELVSELISVSIEMLGTVMGVLGSSIHDESAAPSFEQMGIAVQKAVAKCTGSATEKQTEAAMPGENSTETSVTKQQQLVQTWCWINIRQLSVLLGKLVSSLPLGNVVQVKQVENLATIFVRVLTGCRHRGAIEGCNVGFMSYCTRLLQHPDPVFHGIPGKILDRILDQVASTGSKASVTRRSAGLPLIIQSIVASENKSKRSVLLTHAITRLEEILSQPVPALDQQKDLPHQHALNILKALFREASVAASVQPYIASATIHAIDSFTSPIWAIRNGAMQLFSTLLQRMLGQKKTKDDHLNTMTLQEFFTTYPTLQPFMLDQLKQAAEQQKTSTLQLHPGLYPILTILSKLSAGIAQFEALDDLRSSVSSLAVSPIQGVRELAAAALPSLVPKQDLLSYLSHIESLIPNSHAECYNYNQLHGNLLQIERLLTCSTKSDKGDHKNFAESLQKKCWLLGPSNPCYIVRASYLQLISLMDGLCSLSPHDAISAILDQDLQALLHDQSLAAVGYDQFINQLVSWQMAHNKGLISFLVQCLQSKNQDLILASLQWVSHAISIRSPEDEWLSLQECLCSILLSENITWSILCLSLEAMVELLTNEQNVSKMENIPFGSLDKALCLIDRLYQLFTTEQLTRPGGIAIIVIASLVKKMYKHSDCEGHNKKLVLLLQRSCNASESDHVRLSTARALQEIGPIIVADRSLPGPVLQSLLEITITLLVDESSEVRHAAARFVTHSQMAIPDDIKKSSSRGGNRYNSSDGVSSDNSMCSVLHPNIALKIACHHLAVHCTEPGNFAQVLQTLVTHEAPHMQLKTLIDWASREQVDDLFEPEEVNPYQEVSHISATKVHYLERVVPSGVEDKVLKSTTQSTIEGIATELKNSVNSLEESCSRGPLNVSCNKWVFDAIWNNLQQSKVCFKQCKSEAQIERLTEQLEKLAGISLLHPILQHKAVKILEHVRTKVK